MQFYWFQTLNPSFLQREHYGGEMVLSVLAVKICLLVSGIFSFWNVKTKKGNKGNIHRPTHEIILFEDVKLDDGAFSFFRFPCFLQIATSHRKKSLMPSLSFLSWKELRCSSEVKKKLFAEIFYLFQSTVLSPCVSTLPVVCLLYLHSPTYLQACA